MSEYDDLSVVSDAGVKALVRPKKGKELRDSHKNRKVVYSSESEDEKPGLDENVEPGLDSTRASQPSKSRASFRLPQSEEQLTNRIKGPASEWMSFFINPPFLAASKNSSSANAIHQTIDGNEPTLASRHMNQRAPVAETNRKRHLPADLSDTGREDSKDVSENGRKTRKRTNRDKGPHDCEICDYQGKSPLALTMPFYPEHCTPQSDFVPSQYIMGTYYELTEKSSASNRKILLPTTGEILQPKRAMLRIE